MRYTYDELRTKIVIEQDAIKFCKDTLYEFSNFTPGAKIVDSLGWEYGTVEAYYQGQKTTEDLERLFYTKMTASEAKKAGRNIHNLRKDWDVVKYDIMRIGLRQKFEDTKLKALLLATGNRQIIEWTWWNDQVWGVWSKTGEGCNALGKLLMELRENLRNGRYGKTSDSTTL